MPRDPHKLTLHPNGSFCKRIQGRLVYFGRDHAEAVERLKEYLHPKPRPTTVADVLDAFTASKRQQLSLGSLSPRTMREYESTVAVFRAVIDDARPIESVTAADLIALRNAVCRGKGGQVIAATSQKRLLTFARMVCRYANEEYEPALSRPLRYHKALKLPSAKEIRKARNAAGERLFEAGEIQSLLAIASDDMRGMIYLAINCGFGNGDCAKLPISAISRGWHNFARPKTGVARRCPLWPETQAALKRVIGRRTNGLVFVTKFGNPWEGKGTACPVSYEFRKMCLAAGVYESGRTQFYSLRRTFETIGATTGDQVAVNYIMGHAPSNNDMAAVYRQRTFDSQLRKVTNHVRAWLLGEIELT